jgi:hypothetical protein
MAKIEFSAEEIAVLKKAAAEAQKAAAASVKAVIQKEGINFAAHPARKALAAPEGGAVNSSGCFACFTCLIVGAATLSLAWVND